MGIISSIGLLPTWIGSYALVPHDSKYMIYFKKLFGWETLTDKICIIIAQHLIIYIEKKLNIKYNIRQMENILCKYYQHLSPTCKDSWWYEMMMLSQPKIAMYNQVYSIRTQSGQFYCGEGHLIKEFPYENDTYWQKIPLTGKVVPGIDSDC